MFKKNVKLRKKEHCSQCNEELPPKYMPMSEWKIKGPLCGKCYSKKISQFYPGDHVRVNKSD